MTPAYLGSPGRPARACASKFFPGAKPPVVRHPRTLNYLNHAAWQGSAVGANGDPIRVTIPTMTFPSQRLGVRTF